MMTAIALALIGFGLLVGYAGVTGQPIVAELKKAFGR